MRKKELAKIIIERLKEEYPDADCTLDYNDAWKLLISVRLAAQCTDARVNVVVPHLYEKFPTIDALANADVSEIEEIVRPCGLGRSKARDISLCMRMLRDEFDSKVPDDFNQSLRSLRKLKWLYGKLSLPRKAVTSATDLYITEGKSVLQEQHLIATVAV